MQFGIEGPRGESCCKIGNNDLAPIAVGGMVDARIAETCGLLQFGMLIENRTPPAVVPHLMTDEHHPRCLHTLNMGSFGFGSGQASAISLFARHVQKLVGAFAFGIDSEKL